MEGAGSANNAYGYSLEMMFDDFTSQLSSSNLVVPSQAGGALMSTPNGQMKYTRPNFAIGSTQTSSNMARRNTTNDEAAQTEHLQTCPVRNMQMRNTPFRKVPVDSSPAPLSPMNGQTSHDMVDVNYYSNWSSMLAMNQLTANQFASYQPVYVTTNCQGQYPELSANISAVSGQNFSNMPPSPMSISSTNLNLPINFFDFSSQSSLQESSPPSLPSSLLQSIQTPLPQSPLQPTSQSSSQYYENSYLNDTEPDLEALYRLVNWDNITSDGLENFSYSIQSVPNSAPAPNAYPPFIAENTSYHVKNNLSPPENTTNYTLPSDNIDGEELFGMGLYDGPEPPKPTYSDSPYYTYPSSTMVPTSGKGLKLEETWHPPVEKTRDENILGGGTNHETVTGAMEVQ